MLRQVLLYVGDDPRDLLRVLGDAAELLLVEVGRDLLAQQDLTDNVAEVRGAGAVLCVQAIFVIGVTKSIHTNVIKVYKFSLWFLSETYLIRMDG